VAGNSGYAGLLVILAILAGSLSELAPVVVWFARFANPVGRLAMLFKLAGWLILMAVWLCPQARYVFSLSVLSGLLDNIA
jgi:uncharacterized integral membrane protein